MVSLQDGVGRFAVAISVGEPVGLILEHVGQALDEDERQNVVFELGGVFLSANVTGAIPEHLLHRFMAEDSAFSCAALAAAGLLAVNGFVGLAGNERLAADFLKEFT